MGLIALATTTPCWSQLAVAPPVANPSAKQLITLTYTLDAPAAVSAQVWDFDFELIRKFPVTPTLPAGQHRLVWDGRDLDGRIVPDEGYFFTIEAQQSDGEVIVSDPFTSSGGEGGDVPVGRIDRRTGMLQYQLSRPSRVLLRAGMPGAALLKTIVDWQPRAAGLVTEHWNGRDEDELVNLLEQPEARLVVSYMNLPEATVITVGNPSPSFREYKRALAAPRPKKPERPMSNARRVSPHFLRSRRLDRSIDVVLSFPDHDQPGQTTPPSVANRVRIRVDVPAADRDVLANGPFEVVFFQDFEFVGEEERGRIPYNYEWEVGQLPPGEHILTVNVVTFQNQIGVASRKIRIAR